MISHKIRRSAPGIKEIRRQCVRRFIAITMTASLLSVGLLNGAKADTCGLDPTFGNGGKVLTDFGGDDSAAAAVLQPDNKIVVVGATTSDVALARYKSNGSLDMTFGNAGKVTTDFGGFQDAATSVALQADGKIVIAGFANPHSSHTFYGALARYNTDGSLDDGTANDSTPGDSFGTDGRLTPGVLGSYRVQAVVIQNDGKIVTAGTTDYPHPEFVIERYNTDGSADDTFGTEGRVITDSDSHEHAAAVLIQSTDGKIIVAGSSLDTNATPGTDFDFALRRYNTDGSLDDGTANDSTPGDSFGTGGRVVTDFSNSSDRGTDAAIQDDGKIVVVGPVYHPFLPDGFGLARYHPNGSLDDTFGTGGRVVTDFPESHFVYPSAVAIQPADDKIVVAGYVDKGSATGESNAAFALARYNTDGGLDTSFDGDGMSITDITPGQDLARDVLIQPNGNIVAVGRSSSTPTAENDFALVRYFGDAADSQLRLDSLRLSKNKLPGGGDLEGTVTLCGAAPAGGIKVQLTDTLEAVTVPRAVTVPEGQTSATFIIKTKSVLKAQAGSVIAKLGTSTKSAQLVIQPIGLLSLALEPNPVEGPNPVRGTVVLNGRAPAGGLTVTLSSKNPAVASPTVSSIFIPAGVRQKNFTVETSDVPSPRSVTITATANGTRKSTVLRVN